MKTSTESLVTSVVHESKLFLFFEELALDLSNNEKEVAECIVELMSEIKYSEIPLEELRIDLLIFCLDTLESASDKYIPSQSSKHRVALLLKKIKKLLFPRE